MIITKSCTVCGKKAEEQSSILLGGLKFITLKCGHNITSVPLTINDLDITSSDGMKPYRYQIEGAKFVIENSDGRALIADEMGLGKTIQALMVVRNQNFRALYVVKAGLRIQWFKENIRWLGEDWMSQIIQSEKDFILKGAKGYIISIDLLYRFKDLESWIAKLGIDIVVVDECQTIKNHESKRTNCLRVICKNVEHVIALSGTPIKNHAGEYFPILNILKPEKFPSLIGYQRNWVDSYFNANSGRYQYGGLKNPARFQEYTKDFIIRRTRQDVSEEIQLACGNEPRRMNRFSELGKEVNKMYQNTMNEFEDYMMSNSDTAFAQSSNILAYMSKMRHITGIAKVESVINFVEDFIVENDYSRKLVLFCHHIDVMDLIFNSLSELQGTWKAEFGESISQIRSEYNMERRQSEIELFRSDKCRIMIASTLAASEGLNLQFCSDYGIVERQWNPANEEQAEARFIRIGQKASSVNGTYFIATGTIDEFFAELVERKRGIMKNTLDANENYRWDESSIMKELSEILLQKGGKRFKL